MPTENKGQSETFPSSHQNAQELHIQKDSPKMHDIELGKSEEKGQHGLLEMIPEDEKVCLEFESISAFVLPMFAKKESVISFKRLTGFKKRQEKEDFSKYNQILHHVSGSVMPGEVLAFMGPSGSGKTTLLNIMGGRVNSKQMKVKGVVKFNGEKLDKSMKRKIGFVMQDDLLYESLTVYETLYFAAMLRLPKTMSKSEKIERVNQVISALKLDKCKSTIIGGFFKRGVSGGERKRASVGHELLVNPSILFLDEPTSGLDSTTAMQLLEALRDLAEHGRSIVTTIHQPSSRLYAQLDKLLLLSNGHILYYGKAKDSVDYFEKLSYRIPPLMNAADFILDLASNQVASEIRTGEESTKHLIECTRYFLMDAGSVDGYDAVRDSEVMKTLETDVLVDDTLAAKHASDLKYKGKSRKSFRRLESLIGGKESGDRWGVDFWSQVVILFRRSLKTRRFESLSRQDFLQFLALALLAGMFWFQSGQGDTLVDARDTIGVLFFMLMFLSFRSMFVSLFTFPQEQRHLLKERASGMYRLSAFYIARVLSDFPTDMSIPSLFIIIVYFMVGLRYTAAAFFGIYGTLLLTMFVAQSYGLLLGSYFMNPKTAQAVAAVIMLAFILTAGYFVLNIPVWIAWVKYISFIYYSLGLVLYIQFDAGNAKLYACYDTINTAQCMPVDVDNPAVSSLCQPVDNLQTSLGLNQNISSQGEAVRNGMILLAFLIVLRIAVYFVLKSKTSGI